MTQTEVTEGTDADGVSMGARRATVKMVCFTVDMHDRTGGQKSDGCLRDCRDPCNKTNQQKSVNEDYLHSFTHSIQKKM